MAQRKITPKPMHLDATVHVTNDPPQVEEPQQSSLVLDLLVAMSFVPAAFEPRALILTAVLSVATAIRKAR
jgi:hypothetical protein